MQNISSIDATHLRQTNRLLCTEFTKRNWQVSMLHERSPLIWITRDDGKELVVYGSTPPTVSFVAASIADNKLASYELLKGVDGLRDLETIRLVGDETSELVKDFIARHKRIVVKPIDGAHGKGITTNITDEESAGVAIRHARSLANGSSILLQAQYSQAQPHELRVLCIDGKYIGAIYRQPARVQGDGESTIIELVEKENLQENRGIPYVQLLAAIDIERVKKYLGSAINDIPAKGQWVNVLGIANYGMGGETIDATNEVPDWLIKDALAVAQRLDLPLVGIDFIMKEYPTVQASREDLDVAILEVNRSPSLGIHDEPTSGTCRNAVQAFADYLAKL